MAYCNCMVAHISDLLFFLLCMFRETYRWLTAIGFNQNGKHDHIQETEQDDTIPVAFVFDRFNATLFGCLHDDCGICYWDMQCNGYNGDDVCFVQTFSFASVDPTIKLHQAQSTNLTSWTMPHRNLMLCTHTQSQLFSKKELSHIVSLKSNIWLLNKNIKQQHVRWYVISVLVAQSTIFGNNYLQHRVRYLANMNDHTGCFLWLVPP